MWDHTNLTVQAAGGNKPYESAYADLEAALTWAEGEGYRRVLAWGSSYSASLVFRLAAEHESVTAVLSFSPGEYFEEKGVVAKWASQVKVPCFIAATPEEFLNEAGPIKDARSESPASSFDMAFGLAEGVHGSSTLRQDRAPEALEEYWRRVIFFLRSLIQNSVKI
jgi:dienelactone hydrolase